MNSCNYSNGPKNQLNVFKYLINGSQKFQIQMSWDVIPKEHFLKLIAIDERMKFHCCSECFHAIQVNTWFTCIYFIIISHSCLNAVRCVIGENFIFNRKQSQSPNWIRFPSKIPALQHAFKNICSKSFLLLKRGLKLKVAWKLSYPAQQCDWSCSETTC